MLLSLDPVAIDTKENKASLSRMTLLTQSTDMKASKTQFARKTTKKSTMGLGLSNKLINSEETKNNYNITKMNQEKLKNRLHKFFGLGMRVFWAHVIEISSKNNSLNSGVRKDIGDNFSLGNLN
jgi:hypothetical protein